MMNRVAFPFPQAAVQLLDALAAWARQQRYAGDALGRQGRERAEGGGPGNSPGACHGPADPRSTVRSTRAPGAPHRW
eukprot:3559442-Alexandrium_andersonii.AAC.1